MNNKLKMLLGVAALGGVAYYIYQQNNKKGFANAVGKAVGGACKCHKDVPQDSEGYYYCCDGVSKSKVGGGTGCNANCATNNPM